jgi:hypothetical protein
VVYRRADQGFVREVHQGADAVVPLGEIGTELTVADLYDGVEFLPEPDGEGPV